MTLGVQVGLVLALLTAFTSIVGFLYKHRGAVESPPVEARRPISTSLALFRSPWYTLGIVVAMGSWGFHVAALSLAPISLVQSVIAGGLVLLTVVADRLFGFTVTRREWMGVALTAAGLAFLAATLDGAASEAHNDYEPATLVLYAGVAVAAGLIVARLASDSPRGGRDARCVRGTDLGSLRRVDQGALRADWTTAWWPSSPIPSPCSSWSRRWWAWRSLLAASRWAMPCR